MRLMPDLQEGETVSRGNGYRESGNGRQLKQLTPGGEQHFFAAVQRFLGLFPGKTYDVIVLNGDTTGKQVVKRRTYPRYDLLSSRVLNSLWKHSFNDNYFVYIRPGADSVRGRVLVDDLSVCNLKKMQEDGWNAAVVVRTHKAPPGRREQEPCYQAWVRLPEDASEEERAETARHLAKVYDADRNAARARQYGGFPGFCLPKAKYLDAKGRYPFVVTVKQWSSGNEAQNGREFLRALRTNGGQTVTAPAVQAAAVPVVELCKAEDLADTPRVQEGMLFFDQLFHQNERYWSSRNSHNASVNDWQCCIALLEQGLSLEEVACCLMAKSPGLARRHPGSWFDGYVKLTVGKAAGEVKNRKNRKNRNDDHTAARLKTTRQAMAQGSATAGRSPRLTRAMSLPQSARSHWPAEDRISRVIPYKDKQQQRRVQEKPVQVKALARGLQRYDSHVMLLYWPVFSLHPEHGEQRLELPGGILHRLTQSAGSATVGDKDILTLCLSKVRTAITEGDDARLAAGEVVFQTVAEILRGIRPDSDRDELSHGYYERIGQSMQRLATTQFYIARYDTDDGEKGKSTHTWLGLLDSAQMQMSRGTPGRGQPRSVRLQLSSWLVDDLQKDMTLPIEKDFFYLRHPLLRRLYEIGLYVYHRSDDKRFVLDMKELWTLTGRPYKHFRSFRRELRRILQPAPPARQGGQRTGKHGTAGQPHADLCLLEKLGMQLEFPARAQGIHYALAGPCFETAGAKGHGRLGGLLVARPA